MPTTVFDNSSCPWCGLLPAHRVEACPAVQSVEYYPDGSVKKVEKRHPESFTWPPGTIISQSGTYTGEFSSTLPS